MREIEFRGKGFYNKWHYGSLLVDTYYEADLKDLKQPKEIKVCQIRYKDGWANQPMQVEVDCNTICEYTGLKDRNGNEIFEGDIVKLTEPKLKIEWNAVVEFGNPNGVYDWGYQLKPMTNNAIKYNYNLDILCWVGMEDVNVYCEVIGNVFDNPELVKGENNGKSS